ncbi:MAG: M64 family metallopeptidase, partial [Acidobacteriota bacterium]|nr:M64 family metallopeptidase [Acidobacteriota bacterium]
ARLKWGDLVEDGTPLPTPWNKDEYEEASRAIQDRRRQMRAEGAAEEEMEALFENERERMTTMLAGNAYASKVGAFEGAGYKTRGLYRPSVDCIMFTRDEVGFCPVCRRAVERVIDQYAR